MADGPPRNTFDRICRGVFSIIDGPVTVFREKIVDPIRQQNQTKYYHRKFRRVPGIDECETDNQVCFFEANEQYKRDKLVDGQIIQILRSRRNECQIYHGPADAPEKCGHLDDIYQQAATNFFIKYGDMGAGATVKDSYMKQKHRLIWERRHGPVGGVTATDGDGL